jgi:hypothetical protein
MCSASGVCPSTAARADAATATVTGVCVIVCVLIKEIVCLCAARVLAAQQRCKLVLLFPNLFSAFLCCRWIKTLNAITVYNNNACVSHT